MEEILNIQHHTVRLILKSLNCSKTLQEAAQKCGLNKKSLYNYRRDNNIRYVKEKKLYMITKWHLSDTIDLLNNEVLRK